MIDEGRSLLADALARTAARIGAGSDAWDQLAESRRFIATLVSNVPGMVYRCRNDRDWTMEYVNERCRELTGYDRGELIGNRKIAYADVIHPDDRDRVWDEVQTALAGREPFRIEYRIVTASGEERHVWEQGCGVFSDRDPVAIEGLVLDVSDVHQRRELLLQRERELYRAQKMEAIGQLAGGLAHDFNNVLTVILGNAEVLRESLEGTGDARFAEEILTAARHATGLASRLLAIGKNQPMEREIVDLADTFRRTRPFVDRLIRRDIEVEIDVEPDVWPVHVDPGYLEQVLLNLVINARDAIEGIGRIRIAASNVRFPASAPPDPPRTLSGDCVQLTVEDDGAGMDEATIDRIFEPFFTTKESGTGLGLSTSHGIVRQAGGDILVESKPGRGTTFRIFLPRHAETPEG